MMTRFIALWFAMWASAAAGEAVYKAVEDEFGEGTIHNVMVKSSAQSIHSALLFRCQPGRKLFIQLAAPGHTMFPDKTDDGLNLMLINTKHKFDRAESAITSQWAMNMLKYNDAFYGGEKDEFVRDAMRSKKLSIMQTGRSDVYRFDLAGSGAALRKLIDGCGLEI